MCVCCFRVLLLLVLCDIVFRLCMLCACMFVVFSGEGVAGVRMFFVNDC